MRVSWVHGADQSRRYKQEGAPSYCRRREDARLFVSSSARFLVLVPAMVPPARSLCLLHRHTLGLGSLLYHHFHPLRYDRLPVLLAEVNRGRTRRPRTTSSTLTANTPRLAAWTS